MIDKEILLDSIRNNFSQEITEIIYTCQFEGKSYLDISALNSELKLLQLVSFKEGLSEKDWLELVFEYTPELYDELSYVGKAI